MNDTFNTNVPMQYDYDRPQVGEKETLRNQYHPAFCASMELELRENREHLIFENEYNLNNKPNAIDFLVINKVENIKVKSGLGAIFKKHNLFEFKSFNDSLDERVYYRTLGYVYLYIAYEDKTIVPDEITVSFLREGYPRKLINYFKDEGFIITTYESGIYHIKKKDHVDMQVIVTGRLGKSYAWVNKITNKLKPEDLEQLQKEIDKLDTEIDLINAESVLDMSITLNKEKDFVKEMIGMGIVKDMIKKEVEEKDKTISKLNEQIQNKDKQIQNKDKQIQSQNEQLKGKDEQLKTEKEENIKLRKEIEELKKMVGNKIAMF